MAKRSGKKKKHPLRIVAIVCAVVLLLVGVVMAGGAAYISSLLGLINYDTNDDIDYSNLPMLPDDVNDGTVDNVIENPTPVNIEHIEVRGNTDSITNIMLIGVDGRGNDGYSARSDTNIILSINTETKTIKMASLLRDTWVSVPGVDYDGNGVGDYCKLNAAFYYGGFDTLSKTVEQTFKLDIDQYVAVNFKAFEKAVDAMGGIDIELSEEEARYIPKKTNDPNRYATAAGSHLEPLGTEAGVYHMNGEQTLSYCRIRYLYAESDFRRQSNQRKVLDLLMKKAKTMNFATLTNVLTEVLPDVKTNIPKDELLGYAANALQYANYTIETDYSVPAGYHECESGWIGGGVGLWLTNPESTTLKLHQYLYNIEGPEEEGSGE